MLRNRDLEAMLSALENDMRDGVAEFLGRDRASARSLQRLLVMKQIHGRLRRALDNRRSEAENEVVDFGRWVNGHGALRAWRFKSPSLGKKSARRR